MREYVFDNIDSMQRNRAIEGDKGTELGLPGGITLIVRAASDANTAWRNRSEEITSELNRLRNARATGDRVRTYLSRIYSETLVIGWSGVLGAGMGPSWCRPSCCWASPSCCGWSSGKRCRPTSVTWSHSCWARSLAWPPVSWRIGSAHPTGRCRRMRLWRRRWHRGSRLDMAARWVRGLPRTTGRGRAADAVRNRFGRSCSTPSQG
jgi:hypothetical protein